MIKSGIQNIFACVLDEEDNKDIIFNITDNSQASSILKLNHNEGFYTNINIVGSQHCKTETLSAFLERRAKDINNYNFWNLDIQGSELYVLRGSKELLNRCDAIYTEINSAEVYNGCGLIDDLDKLLEEYNFKRIETKWTDQKWGDALYIKIK